MTQEGYLEYKKIYGDKYFIHFVSTNVRDAEYQTLYDSLVYLRNRILNGAPKDPKYTWALKQKKSGAVYTEPRTPPLTERDIPLIEANIIQKTIEFCNANGATWKNGKTDDEKYQVIEINLLPNPNT